MSDEGFFGQRRGQLQIAAAAADADLDLNFDLIKSSLIAAVFQMLDREIEDTAYWSMPIVWDYGDHPSNGENGPPIDDPTTIDVSVTLVKDCIDLEYRFSLRRLILGELRDCDDPPHRGMLRLRDELRKLADEIDRQCANEQPAVASPQSAPA